MPIPRQTFPLICLGLPEPEDLHQPFAAQPQNECGGSDQHNGLVDTKRYVPFGHGSHPT